jgi:hypothetical protein
MSIDFSLPEVAEVDAHGEVAALYDTIRADTGSALVNYVWRHLATIEGAAQWCWSVAQANSYGPIAEVIGPLADKAAADIAATTPLPDGIAIGPVGQEIVAVYNINNLGNLSRVMLLLEALTREGTETVSSLSRELDKPVTPASGPILPPLPRFSELTREDIAIISALSEAGPAADSGIVPSLWRHLAVEPGLLQQLRTPLAGVLSSSGFTSAFDNILRQGSAQAERMVLTLPESGGFNRELATEGLQRFFRRIAEMTLSGRVVTEWTRASADPTSHLQGKRP